MKGYYVSGLDPLWKCSRPVFFLSRERGIKKRGKNRQENIKDIMGLIENFPDRYNGPVKFSVITTLSVPHDRKRGKRIAFSLEQHDHHSFTPPFPPSHPRTVPTTTSFLFNAFSFIE